MFKHTLTSFKVSFLSSCRRKWLGEIWIFLLCSELLFQQHLNITRFSELKCLLLSCPKVWHRSPVHWYQASPLPHTPRKAVQIAAALPSSLAGSAKPTYRWRARRTSMWWSAVYAMKLRWVIAHHQHTMCTSGSLPLASRPQKSRV